MGKHGKPGKGKHSAQARKTSRHVTSQSIAAGKETPDWKTPAKVAFHKRSRSSLSFNDDESIVSGLNENSSGGSGGASKEKKGDKRPLKKQRNDNNKGNNSGKQTVGASRMGKTFQQNSNSGAVTNASANAYSVDEVVHKAKLMWEQFRARKVTKEQRRDLADKLFAHCRGKFVAISRRHDSSRILQTLVKYGTEAQRHTIASELMPGIVDLSMQHYSKHLVQKLYRASSLADRRLMLDAILPKLKRLLRHKEATVVVDYIFNMHATAPERAEMLGQFYGPDYLLALQRWLDEHPQATSTTQSQRPSNDPRQQSQLRGQIRPPTLSEVVATDDELHARTLRFMTEQVSRAVDKGVPVIRQSLVQTLLDDWYQIASFSSAAEMTASIREQLVEMVHTRSGARACIAATFSGSSKDRKIIVKSLKGYVGDISQQEYAYRFLLAVLAATDDTKLTRTAIITELTKDIGTLCCDRWAVRIVLWILSPEHRKFFTTQDAQELTAESRLWWRPAPRSGVSGGKMSTDGTMIDDDGDVIVAEPNVVDDSSVTGSLESKPVFKKPVDVKLLELRPPIQSAIEAFLLESSVNVKRLLCDQFGSEVLIEAVAASDSSEFVKSVCGTILALCKQPSEDAGTAAVIEAEAVVDSSASDVLSGMFSSRAVKSLICSRPVTLGVPLAELLTGRLDSLATSPGSCFIPLALAEMKVTDHLKEEQKGAGAAKAVSSASKTVLDQLRSAETPIREAARLGLAGAKLIVKLF